MKTELWPTLTNKPPPSEKTLRAWLRRLSLEFITHRQGVYYDGHERDDVVAYRKQFLERMAAYEPFMAQFTDDCEVIILPELRDGGKQVVLVTHDESHFYANDGRRQYWRLPHTQSLRSKHLGQSIHVSEFLTDLRGRLRLNDMEKKEFPDIPQEARVVITTGKNQDGYWKGEDVLKQVVILIQYFFQILFLIIQIVTSFSYRRRLFRYLKSVFLAVKPYLHLIIPPTMLVLLLMRWLRLV